MSGLSSTFGDLPNASDTIIPGEDGFGDAPCGSGSGGAPCFCQCCGTGNCDGLPPCGSCSEDVPSSPNNTSMCQGSGTSIVYRKMCSSSGIDYCAVANNNGSPKLGLLNDMTHIRPV